MKEFFLTLLSCFFIQINSMNPLRVLARSIKKDSTEVAIEKIDKYLKSGGDINARIDRGNISLNILYFAISFNKSDVALYLLNKGVDIKKCIFNKETQKFPPIIMHKMFDAGKHSVPIFKIILALTDLYEIIEYDNGFTLPICCIVLMKDNELLMQCMLERVSFKINASIEMCSVEIKMIFSNIFYAAIFFGSKIAIFKQLIDAGVNIDSQDALAYSKKIKAKSHVINFLQYLVNIRNEINSVTNQCFSEETLDTIAGYSYEIPDNEHSCSIM